MQAYVCMATIPWWSRGSMCFKTRKRCWSTEWTGHRGQDREANPVLESNGFHVEGKSEARARSDHVGWIGTVESSSADARYSSNDKDKCEMLWKSHPGTVLKLHHQREARRLISHWTGGTLSTAFVEQTKTLQSRKCEQKRD